MAPKKPNPSPIKKRKYTSRVNKSALEKAKAAVENKNMSVRQAAKMYNLGKSTLHDYMRGIYKKPVGRCCKSFSFIFIVLIITKPKMHYGI